MKYHRIYTIFMWQCASLPMRLLCSASIVGCWKNLRTLHFISLHVPFAICHSLRCFCLGVCLSLSLSLSRSLSRGVLVGLKY